MTKKHNVVQGIIFDLDGLMVDSERLGVLAWQRFLAPHRFAFTADHYRYTIGRSSAESVDYVLKLTGLDLAPEVLSRGFWDALLTIIGEQLEPMPGLLPFLEELKERGLALGVASNSPIVYVRRAMVKVGIADYFACVFGSDLVANPKPAPDVYLAVVQCLGLEPISCLALEDSPSGVQAAQAARIRCLFIPNPDFSESDIAEVDAPRYPSLSACHEALDDILFHGRQV